MRGATTVSTSSYLPDRPDLLAMCVIWGTCIKPGTDLGKIHMPDIAPTVAGLSGVDLPTAEGRPLLAGANR